MELYTYIGVKFLVNAKLSCQKYSYYVCICDHRWHIQGKCKLFSRCSVCACLVKGLCCLRKHCGWGLAWAGSLESREPAQTRQGQRAKFKPPRPELYPETEGNSAWYLGSQSPFKKFINLRSQSAGVSSCCRSFNQHLLIARPTEWVKAPHGSKRFPFAWLMHRFILPVGLVCGQCHRYGVVRKVQIDVI